MKNRLTILVIIILMFILCSTNSPKTQISFVSSAGASINSALNSTDIQSLIKQHNRVRRDVGVGPVTWSKKIAAFAQKWADNLVKSGCRMKHRPRSGKWKQKYGENIFMGTKGYYGPADAVIAWESEKKFYHGQMLDRSNWYDSGHYTQIVWHTTKKIGCARSECNGNIIIVCNYDPPGNFLGRKPY